MTYKWLEEELGKALSKDKKIPQYVRLTVDVISRLERIAAQLGVTRSTIIEFAINKLLKEHDKDKE